MKKITLLAVLLLCALGMRAEKADPFPTGLVHQAKFTFASLSEQLSQLQAQAYQTETHQSATTGIDLYIHVEGDVVPRVHAWDGNGNITTWPGTELSATTTVTRIGSDVKKDYYKIHFDQSSLSFIVNYDAANNTVIQTNNMNVLEAGSYFFDLVSYQGYDYNHTNNKAETHYTLAPINDYYNGGTDLSKNTIYAKSDNSSIPPSLYCYSTWNKPWDQDWAHWGMNSTTVNGDSQWRVNGPFDHSEISGTIWAGDHHEPAGGMIISDWKNEDTKTCDITWLGGGDYFFYYFPNGHGDKFEPVVLMNGRTNYFQEMSFLPNTTVTDDVNGMSVTMIDENTIKFAEVKKDGFSLTISDPNGVKASDLITNNRLRLYLNSTLTLTQNEGHNINMIAHGAWFGNPSSTQGKVFDTDQMLLAGSFDTPVAAPVNAWGNDYTLIGGDDASTAFNHVAVVDAPSVSYTLTNRNYAIDGKYVEFDSIRVRDDRIPSSIVDLYGTYRGFSWTITSPMVIVRYSGKSGLAGHGENYTGEGIIYCRSLEPSTTYAFPEPTAEQVAKGRVVSHAEQYSNYDWLAIRLSPEMKEEWDKMQPSQYEGFVIKPNTIKGYYCDFIQNLSRLATAFLNPTIVAQRMPEIDENQSVETTLNTYYLFNFVQQDDVFFIPPKRNEVCNVKYTLPSGDDYVMYGTKTEYEDNEGNVFDLKSKVRIYGYHDGSSSKTPEMDDFFNIIYPKSTWEMCRDNETAIVRDALVQMIDHHGEVCYKWNPNRRENPNTWGDGEAEYLKAPRHAEAEYFYNPIDATSSDAGYNPLGYLLPELDYGGGGDVREVDGKIVKFYGVFPQHRLAINPNLAARNPKNVDNPYITAIDEIIADKTGLKTVATVEYYNATGMKSHEAFDGFNIVVTRYSDGTSSTRKIIHTN